MLGSEATDLRRTAEKAWLEQAWGIPARVSTVHVEEAAIRYRGWGLGDGSLPGLIFVHGFMAHSRWWDHIAPRFATSHRAIAPDLSGMGDSDRRPEYSRRQFARELLAAADDAGLGKLTIVAHSFGALSALYTGLIAPERIERVIVIDAFIFRPGRDEPMEIRPPRFYSSRQAAEARFRLGPPGLWPDPDLLAYIAHHSVTETARGWTWKFDPQSRASIDKEHTLRDELRDLTIPVDFIHGDRSEVVDAEALAALKANMPSCGPPIAIAACHHHVMIEQPLALVAVLNALLSRRR